LIALLSNQFPRAGVKKKRAHRRRGLKSPRSSGAAFITSLMGRHFLTSWLPTVLNANGVPLAHFLR
jgi:hypothetical protein